LESLKKKKRKKERKKEKKKERKKKEKKIPFIFFCNRKNEFIKKKILDKTL
jgi:hypothetical protein